VFRWTYAREIVTEVKTGKIKEKIEVSMGYPVLQRELTVHLHNGNWYLRPIEDPRVLGPVDYGWYRYNAYPDSFTFGEGLLAGSSIPGSRRLVFASWSPQWDGFYISSMGGAAYSFHNLGVNYVALRGKCEEPSVLIMNHKQGEISVRLEAINVESIWTRYASEDGVPLYGFYALQQAIFDRYAKEFPENRFRIFAIGPASKYTREGIIGSNPIRKGKLSHVIDWAGRGGLGSRLFQYHHVVGCIFGGEWDDPDLRDSAEIDQYFMEHFGKKTIQTDLAVTQKYRYFPEFETGGTFGVNMRTMDDRMMSFNYRSIYKTAEERLLQHENFILNHYLKQFNEETIVTKSFQHCGEPCAVVCKKMKDQYKKDYEPYHALGPQVGVFDQRAAEVLNDHADAMGFDAIQLGGTLAWIMEILQEGLIPAHDFGFPPVSEMAFDFASDPEHFDLIKDSMKNANYASALMDAILFDLRCDVFRQGIRSAARDLDKKYKVNTTDRAVFIRHGESGHMVPNQYWTPGMLSPMPVMGKYFVFYNNEFLPPYELGKKNVERMVYELFNDNSGICRFHRKWAETITDEILCVHYDLSVDYKTHQFQLAREIFEREGMKSMPWNSERVIDLVIAFLEFWQVQALNHPELNQWIERFEEDKNKTALAFWQEIRRGQVDAFKAGAEMIPDQLSPGQQNNNQQQT
jgi:glyceraldehyde-3-phosphate dehydrogenase (ferredoxin)